MERAFSVPSVSSTTKQYVPDTVGGAGLPVHRRRYAIVQDHAKGHALGKLRVSRERKRRRAGFLGGIVIGIHTDFRFQQVRVIVGDFHLIA